MQLQIFTGVHIQQTNLHAIKCRMFNEHVYRCSLNNKTTILSNSPENQQANKLCKILSFHVRRFFEHNVARFKIYPAQDGTSIKETIVEQHVNFESGRWFLCPNSHAKVCVRALVKINASLCVYLNLIQKKKMRNFNSYHQQKMNEQSMGGWKEENRWQRRKECDIHRWLRQFHVDKLLRVGE